MNQSKEMTKLAIAALEDKKANDVRVIDIAGVSVIADYFVIASGSNTNQVQAMADSVREALGRAGHEPRQVEGYGSIVNRRINLACLGFQLCQPL